MTQIQAQPPYVTRNNGSPTTSSVASEYLQVSSNGLVFEDQQRFPGVTTGNGFGAGGN